MDIGILCLFKKVVKSKKKYSAHDEENRFINRLYFVLSTLSTTGYGDVTPKSKNMKIIVMVFQFILLISLIDILSDNEYITKLFK